MQRRTLLSMPLLLAATRLCAARPLRVATSFNAVTEIVRAVAGDSLEVIELIADGTEPHDFTPTARTLARLRQSDLLVTAGNGMEPWAPAAARSAGAAQLLEAAAGFGSEAEPHAWLAPAGVRFMARRIAERLTALDAARGELYRRRLADYTKALDALSDHYRPIFAAAPVKTIVTGHAAFGALCAEFGLQQKSVEDVFAQGEPTARKLADLARWCRAQNVSTIFSETLVSPAVSETLAREAGARVVPIFTMESSEDGSTLLNRMEKNLKRIEEALFH